MLMMVIQSNDGDSKHNVDGGNVYPSIHVYLLQVVWSSVKPKQLYDLS